MIATTAARTNTTTLRSESIPATWLSERDDPFFRITSALFDSRFTAGATVLLASYDCDGCS